MTAAHPSWSRPASPPPLRHDEVHVWRASLDVPEARILGLTAVLSEDELDRAYRFHHQQDRSRYITGRGLLRILLGRYLDEEPRNLRFSYSPYRKPSLAGSERSLRFNLSHSDGLVLFAVACGRDVGVDVERLRELRDAEAIARRFFSVSENAALRDLPPEQRLEGFYRCWTRKEAFIKALGEGLSRPLDSFDVSIAGPAALLRMETQDVERWTLHDVMPGGEYTGALAVEGDVRVTCYHYHSVGVALPQRAFA